MIFAASAFIVIFLLLATGLLLAFYRESLGQRLASVVSQGQRKNEVDDLTPKKSEQILANFSRTFDKIVPASTQEQTVIQKRLGYAGLRQEWQLSGFNSSKYIAPVILGLLVWASGLYQNNPFIIFPAAFVLGYLAPDYWLSFAIKSRQNQIRLGLPDVLDLLVICLEAGLSLDQAVMRTSEEMSPVHPAIADELNLVVLDIRGGRSRIDSWKQLADRTDVDVIRMLVSILIQADQFGTGISRTLRVHSETLRTRRKQKVEEIAAKTTVKLVFPLVFFIFPSMFIVTLGPAFILFQQAFKTN